MQIAFNAIPLLLSSFLPSFVLSLHFAYIGKLFRTNGNSTPGEGEEGWLLFLTSKGYREFE